MTDTELHFTLTNLKNSVTIDSFIKHVVAEDGTEFKFYAFVMEGELVTLADAVGDHSLLLQVAIL